MISAIRLRVDGEELGLRGDAHPELGALDRQARRRAQLGSLLAQHVEALAGLGHRRLEAVDLQLPLGEPGVQHDGGEHQHDDDADEHQRGVDRGPWPGHEAQLGTAVGAMTRT